MGATTMAAPYSLYFIYRFSDRVLPLSWSIHAFFFSFQERGWLLLRS
jgi:hypothetical protein